MVSLDLVHTTNTALTTSHPLVAVFVGVAGIAGFSIRALASAHGASGKGLRAYIVGRNVTSGQKVSADCQKLCPAGKFIFVQAEDLALIKDVDAVCAEIHDLETNEESPRIDILVMAQAIFEPFGKRKETTEGLDTFMSLLYYSRIRLITKLLPLLLSSSLPAHIISIFGPQRDTTLIPSDLSLRDPKNYGFMSSGSHAAYFKTFFFEHLARKYEGKISLVHYFPGLVLTEAFNDPSHPRLLRWTFKYGAPLMRLMAVKGEESGERVIFNASPRFPARGEKVEEEKGGIGIAVASNGLVGGGAYKVDWNGELIEKGKQYQKLREEGWEDKVVQHTLKVFEEIDAGRTFKD